MTSELPRIQYVKTEDGVSIAYWIMGSGSPVVSLPAVPLSNQLGLQEMLPQSAQSWAAHFRVAGYDSRGSGLSDRSSCDFSMPAMLRDLEAVHRRLTDGPITINSVFDSVPIAITYAARHPERVSALMLVNGWSRYSEYDELPARAAERALRHQDWTLYTETLARVLFSEMFDEQVIAQMAAYLRSCVEQECLIKAYNEIENYDVTAELASIQARTLVLFNRRNRFLSPQSSQRLAAAIAGAEYRVFDDITYLSVPEIVNEWLTGERSERQPASAASAFRTVLFTDLVTCAIREQIICVEVMSGNETSAVQSVAYPNCAPETAYVPIPDGSSSEAPVITPGPSRMTKRLSRFFWRRIASTRGTLRSSRSLCGVGTRRLVLVSRALVATLIALAFCGPA